LASPSALLQLHRPHRRLHCFPTRRSSDLSILRGKDLETEQFSEERRVAQFARLREAQDRTLNLTNWHDFLNVLNQAGFRSGKMRSEEHTSELQSRENLVCRLLLEKKKIKY